LTGEKQSKKKLKYPIVILHGFADRPTESGVERDVEDDLDKMGIDYFTPEVSAFGSIEERTKEFVKQILEKLKLIQFAESLGGVESLITYPITQTHADVPPEDLKKSGMNDRILRLSVGIENIEDLIHDFEQAFS